MLDGYVVKFMVMVFIVVGASLGVYLVIESHVVYMVIDYWFVLDLSEIFYLCYDFCCVDGICLVLYWICCLVLLVVVPVL